MEDYKSSRKNLCISSTTVLRLLQVDLDSLKAVALIGVIHGVAEVIERSIIVLIDYIYHQLYERRRLSWGSFRTARRERLATDIAIMSMLCEASAVISVSGFLHLHEYFYTDGKTVPQLLQSFAITSSYFSSSTGYRVVLHVFKYSYRDSVSEQANSGSLAKAMEKTLNSCYIKYICDSFMGKWTPCHCYRGTISSC